MKMPLTALALALAVSGVQAQQDSPEGPRVAPVPPVAPVAPVAPVPELPAFSDGGIASQILSSERVVKGAPYCANAVHETVQPLADGNRIVHRQTSRLCRDGEGRTRQEVERQDRRYVYLRDPANGENWLLDPDRKTARYLGGRAEAEAHREYNERMRDYNDKMREYARGMRDWAKAHTERVFGSQPAASGDPRPAPPAVPASPARADLPKPPVPPAPPRAPTAVVIAPGEPGQELRMIRIETPMTPTGPMPPIPVAVSMRIEPLVLSGDNIRTETLPARELDGLKVTGSRISSTIAAGKVGNEKPIVITREVWTSTELQVTVSSQTKDPRSGEQNYQLRDIRRAEPDAALMRVPTDYRKTGEPKPRTPKEGKDGKDGKDAKQG